MMIEVDTTFYWVLSLNDMRHPKVEILTPIAKSGSEEALEALLERERVPPYVDGRWSKEFRKGGPLEWFNPPVIAGGIVKAGSAAIIVKRVIEKWREELSMFPDVGSL